MTNEILLTPVLTAPRRRLLRNGATANSHAAVVRPVLVFSDDAKFWQSMIDAAQDTGWKLLRRDIATGEPRLLRMLNPAAILFDLDSAITSRWDTADSLLQDANCPLLLLVASHREQLDYQTAILAGCLLDKSADPRILLRTMERKLQGPTSVRREQNNVQRELIRWLKPWNWSAQSAPLHRFWGINE